MVCWSISTIDRIWQAFKNSDVPFEMYFFQSLLLPAQGIFNLLVYVAPSQLRKCCSNQSYGEGVIATNTSSNLDPDPLVQVGNIVRYEDDDETIKSWSFTRS